MQLNSHNLKYLYTSLLSLVAVSCNEGSKKSNSDKFDGSNFVTVNDKNYNKNFNISNEINKNNSVVKLEGINHSTELKELMYKVSPISVDEVQKNDKETDIYLYKNKENNLSIVATRSNSKETEKEVGKMIYAELNSENKSNQEENNLNLDKSSVTVTIFEDKLSCFMPKFSKNDSQLIDYCDKKANVKLHFKVDMSGSRSGEFVSKEDPKQKIKTSEGKFITFSISPTEGGGPGWHIADNIYQEKSKYGDKISTVAGKYIFEINSDLNDEKPKENHVHIADTFPTNINPKITSTVTRGYNFGLSGGLKLGGKAEFKPAVSPATGLISLGEVEATAGAELSANILRTSSRTMHFETHEYTVESNSNANKAMWIWDAKIPEKICTYLTNYDSQNCDFSTAPWNTRWASNINMFSAISHKSFQPAFWVTYQTSKENKGISTFEISTRAQTAVVFGNVSQLVVKKSYSLEVGTGEIFVKPIVVSVNWNSPFFASEENIRLQRTNSLYATKCLAVDSSNKNVSLADCDSSYEQIWGYDIELKQFKSRTGQNNLCLALVHRFGEDVAVAEPCFANSEDKVVKNNQIWEFTKEGYIKSVEDPEQRVLDTNENGNLVLKVPSKSTPKFKAYDAKL
nr:hypothetical protein GTC16762_12680 [Pigmentibacter ruber]